MRGLLSTCVLGGHAVYGPYQTTYFYYLWFLSLSSPRFTILTHVFLYVSALHTESSGNAFIVLWHLKTSYILEANAHNYWNGN